MCLGVTFQVVAYACSVKRIRLREFKSFDSNVTSLSPSVNQNDTSHLEGALRARVNISKELSSSRVLQGYREVKRYCQWRSFDAPT